MPTPTMRAKLVISSVERLNGAEKLKFNAVCAKSYPPDGKDENNTYAKYSPSASLEIYVANPDLHGKFNPGQEFYVDFTPAAGS